MDFFNKKASEAPKPQVPKPKSPLTPLPLWYDPRQITKVAAQKAHAATTKKDTLTSLPSTTNIFGGLTPEQQQQLDALVAAKAQM
jgi:hypothetical protein